MDELGRPGVAHGSDDVAGANGRGFGHPRCDGVEVAEQEEVVAKPSAFAQRVTRHDGVSEERPRVDDLGVALLVIERDDRNGGPARLWNVEPTVADGLERAPATL